MVVKAEWNSTMCVATVIRIMNNNNNNEWRAIKCASAATIEIRMWDSLRAAASVERHTAIYAAIPEAMAVVHAVPYWISGIFMAIIVTSLRYILGLEVK